MEQTAQARQQEGQRHIHRREINQTGQRLPQEYGGVNILIKQEKQHITLSPHKQKQQTITKQQTTQNANKAKV